MTAAHTLSEETIVFINGIQEIAKMAKSHDALVAALQDAIPVLTSAVGNAEPSSNCWQSLATDTVAEKQSKADTIARYERAKARLSKANQALSLAGAS